MVKKILALMLVIIIAFGAVCSYASHVQETITFELESVEGALSYTENEEDHTLLIAGGKEPVTVSMTITYVKTEE